MNFTIKHLCIGAAALLVASTGAAVRASSAADTAQAQAKLADVRARIAVVTARLGEQLQQRDTLNGHLREVELKITAARLRLDALRRAERLVERRRDELRASQVTAQHALDQQRGALAAQVRAAYLIGREDAIKLLLNQSDPAGAARMLAFYGYIVRERSARIDEIRARLAEVQTLIAQVAQATDNLETLRADTAREVESLTQSRSERAAALAAVGRQVTDGNQQLAELKREELAVETLVADLSRVMQDFPVDSQQSFETLRGKLPWPVPGKLAARYQEARDSGNPAGSRWNGVLIESARGTKVRAAYFGRVIYADWLQGLGLLLIIGHSGNYMTLYGHAEVLYKSVGDWVAPGDVIAGLSDAGGPLPQLYFEIRDGRKVVDPKLWLKASP